MHAYGKKYEIILRATADNTAYTAHFVRPNFGYAETSYMLKTLSAMGDEIK